MQGHLHFHDTVPGTEQTTLSLAQQVATGLEKCDKRYMRTRVRAGCFALFLELSYNGQEDTYLNDALGRIRFSAHQKLVIASKNLKKWMH